MEEIDLFDRIDFDDPLGVVHQFNNPDLRSMYVGVLCCPSDEFPPLSDEPTEDDRGNPLAPSHHELWPFRRRQKTFSWRNDARSTKEIGFKPAPAKMKLFAPTFPRKPAASSRGSTSPRIFSKFPTALPKLLPWARYCQIATTSWFALVIGIPNPGMSPHRSQSTTIRAAPVRRVGRPRCRARIGSITAPAPASSRGHPGGANFVLADGAVPFISENIDYANYQRLGDRQDSETVEPF